MSGQPTRIPASPPNSGGLQKPQQPNSNHHNLSFAYSSCTDRNEKTHWDEVCRAYRNYAAFATKQFGLNHPSRLAALSPQQQRMLPAHLQAGTNEFAQIMKNYKDAAIRNQFCLDCILRHAGQAHSQQALDSIASTEAQLSKVSSTLKSLARDWSEVGKKERDMCYGPVLRSVQKYLPKGGRICVPGAGVGRLACELAALRYTVQGNEFSLYMLLASDFILNGPLVANINGARQPLSISPWLMETRNVHRTADPIRTVQIPDVDPASMVSGEAGFSMAAGDFESIYGVKKEASSWDAIVSCFFLDASPNIINYLQIIHHMLKPGGYLINFGPLHWHWSGPPMLDDINAYRAKYSHLDPKYLSSYDYTWDDVRIIMENIGFEILECDQGVPALYTADPESMLQTEYRCIHLVARKR